MTRYPLYLPQALLICALILFQLITPVGTVAFDNQPSTIQPRVTRVTTHSYPDSGLTPPGSIDASSATTTFTVAPGDFLSETVVSEVTIDITFSKVGDGTCPGPGGGRDWAEEIRLRLSAPDGTMVTLVNFNDYAFSDPDVGQVTVTFDDNAAQPVAGLPIQDGTFQPSSGAMADFDGIDPAANGGVWTLELTDQWLDDPLCFASATLHIATLLRPNISVEVTDLPDPVKAGEDLFYDIAVHNTGSSIATGVTVTDTLPAELVYVDDTGGCSLSAGTGPGGADQLICAIADVAPGASQSVQVQTHVPADAVVGEGDGSLAIYNIAQAASALGDDQPADNTATEPTFVQDEADLRVVKLSQPSTTVQAGEAFTYTITVDNLGPSAARSVTLTDTILSSGNFDLVGITDDPDRADACTLTPAPGGSIIECALGAPLEPQGHPPGNGRWTLGMILRANEAQDVDNVVDVTSATPDPDLANNQAIDFISVTAVADLDVDKPLIAPVTAGTAATYTVIVTNDGPSTAQNVTLVDELPVGMTLIFPFDPGFDCSVAAPTLGSTRITCGLGDLSPGKSKTLVTPVIVDADVADGTVLVNGASVTSDTFDDDNSDNHAEAATLVLSEATLTIAKTGSPSDGAAGETVEYRIAVDNAGPSVAHEVFVTDDLPQELVVLSTAVVRGANGTPAGSGGACSTTTDPYQVTCQMGQMPPGERATITILARTASGAVPADDPDGSVVITNRAEVAASNATPAHDTANTTIHRIADLRIGAIADPAVVTAGGQAEYAITASNDGPSDAVNVVVTATLPAEAAYEVDTAHCTLASTTPDVLTCQIGTLAAGERWQADVFAQVAPDAAPGQTITTPVAIGAAPITDPDATNDTAAAEVMVLGLADLRITKFGRPASFVQAGERLTYTILVDNLGTGYAHDVVVADLIQSDGAFDLVDVISDRPATCTPGPGAYAGELAMECELAAALEVMTPGTSGRWQLLVVVQANEAQSISNVADVAGSDDDPDGANNHAVVHHEVTDLSDLSITSTAMGQAQVMGQPGGTLAPEIDGVTAGCHLTYTLIVRNHGPSRAENVVVQDRLPAWVDILSVASSQGVCNVGVPGDPSAPEICNLGHLSAQRNATITVAVAVPSWVPSGTLLYNEALAFSDTYDPLNVNDFDTDFSLVEGWGDIALTKTQQPATALPGQPITYVISVRNTGPSDVFDAVISDALPAGVDGATWDCTASAGATCTPEGSGDLDDTISTLPAGEEIVYTIRGTLSAHNPVTNTATADTLGSTGDPYLENNSDRTTNQSYAIYLPLVLREGEDISAPDLVVEAIQVTASDIRVVIRNDGAAPVVDAFWVDAYIDPEPVPRAVNQTWIDVADSGCVWGISSAALPLEPGATLALSIGGDYYWESLSAISLPLPSGAAVYAQVDSYNPGADYGNVEETHEISNEAYNNIAGPILAP